MARVSHMPNCIIMLGKVLSLFSAKLAVFLCLCALFVTNFTRPDIAIIVRNKDRTPYATALSVHAATPISILMFNERFFPGGPGGTSPIPPLFQNGRQTGRAS